ncbi:MAG TPA: hypothetical protein VFU55_14535 [Terracidiphilus sp.]|nr:hypothetical protein [Terracidiphilus sp.]
MSGKAEMEEGKTAETLQAEEAHRPQSATQAAAAVAEASTEAQEALRPRTRMIEKPGAAEKIDAEKLRPVPAEVKVLRPAAPVRPLARKSPAQEPAVRYTGLERVMDVARKVIPVVRKVLPLLDGNVPLTVANLLAPTLEAPRRPVDLHPLEAAVDKLHSGQVELRTQVVAQAASLHHLSEQVAALQEQADRNAREREEMAEGLRRLRRRVIWVAWLGFVLLAASLAANGILLARALGWMR